MGVLEKVHITLNKNAVHGDVSAMSPGGVRIGAPAMTTRGLKEADFVKIGEFLLKALELTIELQKTTGKKLVDFLKGLETKEMEEKLAALKTEGEGFAAGFSCPATKQQRQQRQRALPTHNLRYRPVPVCCPFD